MFQPSGAWAGQRATWVAIAAVTMLVLSLITSVWHSDTSGTVALLGLLSVYMSSSELLVLFIILAPFSILLDIIRLSGKHFEYNARGWLVLFSIAGMLAKVAGSVIGWSLHRSIQAGESGGAYQPIQTTHNGDGLPTSAVGQPPQPPYQPALDTDPFAGYAPPRSDVHGTQTTYQPFPQNPQGHL